MRATLRELGRFTRSPGSAQASDLSTSLLTARERLEHTVARHRHCFEVLRMLDPFARSGVAPTRLLGVARVVRIGRDAHPLPDRSRLSHPGFSDAWSSLIGDAFGQIAFVVLNDETASSVRS